MLITCKVTFLEKFSRMGFMIRINAILFDQPKFLALGKQRFQVNGISLKVIIKL